MVITIDGPAGAGKSSAARRLAQRLGFHFLDTGAMYRTVALAAVRQDIPWHDQQALGRLARELDIEVTEDRVTLNTEDVTQAIRKMEITSVIHYVADHPGIRETLVNLQRRVANSGNYVTEGRDQGTVVFPHADCKFFLTASAEERARRRMADILARGESLTFQEILQLQNDRDARDFARPVGRLVQAEDAQLVNTDGLPLEEVVNQMERIARQHLRFRTVGPSVP